MIINVSTQSQSNIKLLWNSSLRNVHFVRNFSNVPVRNQQQCHFRYQFSEILETTPWLVNILLCKNLFTLTEASSGEVNYCPSLCDVINIVVYSQCHWLIWRANTVDYFTAAVCGPRPGRVRGCGHETIIERMHCVYDCVP